VKRRAIGASFLVIGVAACGPPAPVVLIDRAQSIRAEQYDEVLDRWTRERELIDWEAGLESRVAVTTTYYAPEFRRAYVARYARAASLPEPETARMLATSLSAGAGEHEFFVTLAAQSPRWGALERSDGAWRVRLIDDRGREHVPRRIERFRAPTPTDRAMFYYWTPWRAVYRVRFAATDEAGRPVLGPDTRRFALRLAGAYGTVDLRWDVRAP
jgi:hypothetical protein